jgi:hypothetical protein
MARGQVTDDDESGEEAPPAPPPGHAPHARPRPVEVRHLPPQWRPLPPRPRLPIGAAILALLIAVIGLVILLAGVLVLLNLFFGNEVPAGIFTTHSVDEFGASILILLGAVMVSVASALWRQERWSLWVTIVVVFLGLAYLFFTASITVLFVLLLVVFIYLLTVRRHFY